MALLLGAAVVLLFMNLGAAYLWQDEAMTAVLGERLMAFGQPLAYDGVNLITMDNFVPGDTLGLSSRTGDPGAAVRYYAARNDFRENTAWTGNPWGQFLAAGLSLEIFGHTTEAARLPFAVAAFLTVALLAWFVGRQFQSPWMGWLSAAVLLTNVFWVIHARQCRYYSLSGLFLLLTLIAFFRWQSGERWGALLFIGMGWCWFQMDYGLFFPMMGILLAAGGWGGWPRIKRALIAGCALGISIAPWVWYYELLDRLKPSGLTWKTRFTMNLFHFNEYLVPVIVILGAAILLILRRNRLESNGRRLLLVSLGMLAVSLVWIPSVIVYPFHRYLVPLAPLASLCIAWLASEAATLVMPERYGSGLRGGMAVALAALVTVVPILPNLAGVRPQRAGPAPPALLPRPEWHALYEEVFAPPPDPNRLTVEALRSVASPGDEILINYEDVPLMFYTGNPIRGGIPCFRVEDRSGKPPRFLVYRRSVPFGHTSIFDREIGRYRWRALPLFIPDRPWGNNPEPSFRMNPTRTSATSAIIAERVDSLRSD